MRSWKEIGVFAQHRGGSSATCLPQSRVIVTDVRTYVQELSRRFLRLFAASPFIDACCEEEVPTIAYLVFSDVENLLYPPDISFSPF